MVFTIGDTVRLKAEFKNWVGSLVSPADVKLKLYRNRNELIGTEIDVAPVSTGKYQYDYTIPADASRRMYFEYSGTLEGTLIVGRMKIATKWV